MEIEMASQEVLKLGIVIFKLIGVSLINLLVFLVFFFLKGSFFSHSLFIEWELFFTNSSRVVFSLIFDAIRLSFLILVLFISSFVIFYSFYYMIGDNDYFRFSIILLIFVVSIIFLIISPNLISLLLGWDGLGLTSYALVIYYQSESSCNSGIITVLRNRVGDSCLLLVIGGILYKGRWNFCFFYDLESFLLLLIILGSFTKRAQIPFSAWLPAAMAAPTPVSSLVHSSTLVTAGVYLLIRFSFYIGFGSLSLIIFIAGLLTIFIRGLVANFEADLKKVIALSTLRQLGLMIVVLGLGNYILAFFHLIIHAIFKSTLFIRRGFIIHNRWGRQDGRFLGSFGTSSPILGLIFCCTNLALCGFPFLAGFFSKDLIIELSFSFFFLWVRVLLLILCVGLTVIYRLRVLFMISRQKGKLFVVTLSSDFRVLLFLSLFLLFLIRVMGGFLLSHYLLDLSGLFILRVFEKFYVLIICFASFLLIYNFILFLKKKINFGFLLNFLSWIIFLPQIRGFFLRFLALKHGSFRFKIMDKGWLEVGSPSLLGARLILLRGFSQRSQFVITISQYFLFVLIFFIAMFCFLYLKSSLSVMLKP